MALKDWFGSGGDAMQAAGISVSNMRHVHSRTYQLQCNWKVFCDNYLVSPPLKVMQSLLELSGRARAAALHLKNSSLVLHQCTA